MRRFRLLGGVVVAVTAITTGMVTPVSAVSSDAVISEVYGGGGNSGATLRNDFIELATVGSTATDLAGWSVQYLPAKPSAASKWQVTSLSGAVQPGKKFLVAEAAGAGGTVALPNADATGKIALSATAGTVALVHSTEPLSCVSAADCAADTRVRDLVGYGDATVREGKPTATLSATTSAQRRGADTDDNAADFSVSAPTPTNARGETTPTDPDEPGPTEPGDVRIPQIHGHTFRSPLDGQRVAGVPGIVTAVATEGKAQGFWFADPTSKDPLASSALQVFTGSRTPDVRPGDEVLVSGTVQDYFADARPEDGATSLPVTELTKPVWTVLSSGHETPKPLVLNAKNVPNTLTADAGGKSIEHNTLQPERYALDFYKAHEGETVRVDNARVVGPSNDYGEMWITARPEQNPTRRGGTVYPSYADSNTGRLLLTALPGAARLPVANVGDHLRGSTAGPLSYSKFGGYQILATQSGVRVDGGIKPEVTRSERWGEFSTATYNVENLSPKDDPSKFARLADGVVRNLSTPDVVSLEEIQDNDGPDGTGVVAADKTLREFTDAIVTAGGPRYEWREIDPVYDADGGQPHGNIRTVLIFNPARVSFVDKPGGTATSDTTVTGNYLRPHLSASPGRIAPNDPAWRNSRKPLVGEFSFAGHSVFVIANHFNSKGGDQPLEGRFQYPQRSSEQQRVAQAGLVNGFVKSIEKKNPLANVVVLGDLNDYQFSPALKTLTSGGALTDLITTLPRAERYSYVYQGNSQVLDHILVSPAIRLRDYDVVHTNSEFADQVSDHDPQVLRFYPIFP